MKKMRSLVVLIAWVSLWGVGCGDEEGSPEAPANNSVANNSPSNNAANNSPVNNAVNNNAVNNAVNNNTPPEVPPCEEVEAADGEIAYDAYLLPPLDDLVGRLEHVEAVVRRSGGQVEVLVGEDDPITATFSAEAGLEHCVAYDELPALKLCFFKADGTPGAPGALEATFRPQGPNLFAVVAHRRGLMRPCTVQGHYALEVGEVEVLTGDASVEAAVVERLLDYLAVFEIEGRLTALIGDEPRTLRLELDPATQEVEGSLEDDVLVVGEGQEWDLTLGVTGRFSPESESGGVELTVEVSISDPTGGVEDTTLVVSARGRRQ